MSQPNSSEITADLLQKLIKELPGKRALIVDRHPNARTSLRIMLSTLGITAVHSAGHSAEVIRQVKTHHFDIILSDYLLDDGRDGQQLLEELRHQHLIPLSTVFMIITGERAYQKVVSVAELAPDDYLIKPFTADQLESRLMRAIYKKHFFGRVFELLDNGAYADALAACESLIVSGDIFFYDTLRFKGEILNVLGRHAEAEAVYQEVLKNRMVPWARMGLAVALRGQAQLAEAELLGQSLIDDFPEYLAAYDFVADVREEQGKLTEAQEMLLQAAAISPNNSARQRLVGDVAVRNNDLEAAERAFNKVLERHRGSSLKNLDDYANLSRVMLDRGHTEGARKLSQEIRRELRGSPQGELTALVIESLCADKEGDPGKARVALDKALALHGSLGSGSENTEVSRKIAVDLAHACLVSGDETSAQRILRKIAAENHEDRSMISHIEGVFTKTGREDAGQAMLAQVGQEIVELNNRGVLAARQGDIEASVQLLMEAADRVPNLQFLVNATKAIFTLLERRGWDETMAEHGVRYLQLAQTRDARSAKVISARELYQSVARKFGIAVVPIGGARGAAEKQSA
ncbi:MAG: response regulator [Betaproteobacteria bacterium]|nr:response regulator [Betaproteobacteria bacterium]